MTVFQGGTSPELNHTIPDVVLMVTITHSTADGSAVDMLRQVSESFINRPMQGTLLHP